MQLPLLVVVVVLVVVTSQSGSAYMGRQVPCRDEEFQHISIILKHMMHHRLALTFCFPFLS